MKILVLLSLSLLVACGGKKQKEHKSNPPSTPPQTLDRPNKVFVQGDPMTLIAGATMNKESFFTKDNLEEFNGFLIVGGSTFIQKSEVEEEEEERESAEDGNEAADGSKPMLIKPFAFEKGEKEGVWHFANEELGALSFKENGSKVEMTSDEEGFEVIHYSLREDRKAFSVLFKVETEENGSILSSFVFAKNGGKTTREMGNPNYKYLVGPGILNRWDQSQSLTISLCTDNGPLAPYYLKTMEIWQKALEGRLDVQTQVLQPGQYPPFSDLNTNCVYAVDNYLQLEDDDYINRATVFPSINESAGQMVSAPAFFWLKEWEKQEPLDEASDNALFFTFAHELGHVFGLAHQFDKETPSFLSYKKEDEKLRDLTFYDRAAIHGLYPIIENLDPQPEMEQAQLF